MQVKPEARVPKKIVGLFFLRILSATNPLKIGDTIAVMVIIDVIRPALTSVKPTNLTRYVGIHVKAPT